MAPYSVISCPVITGGHLKRRRIAVSDYQQVDGDVYVSLLKGNREVSRLIGLSLKNLHKTKLHKQLRELRNKELDKATDIADGVHDNIDIGLGDDDDMPIDRPKVRRKRNHHDLPPTLDVTCPAVDQGADVVIKMLPTTMYQSACMVMLHPSTIEYLVKRVQKDIDEYEGPDRRQTRGQVLGIVDSTTRNMVVCRWKDGSRVKQKQFKYASLEEKSEQEAKAQEFMAQRTSD